MRTLRVDGRPQARLQREFDAANKAREGEDPEDEENDLEFQLSGDGKRLKKIMKKHRTDSDEGSDEEGNPYASSVSFTTSLPERRNNIHVSGGRGRGGAANHSDRACDPAARI
jgi:hypothetical protein